MVCEQTEFFKNECGGYRHLGVEWTIEQYTEYCKKVRVRMGAGEWKGRRGKR